MTNLFKPLLLAAAMACFGTAHADAYNDFFRAVRNDNTSSMIEVLNAGFDPNTKDDKGQTGLLIAMREPSPKVTAILIGYSKTNVDARNASDETPLMMAALKGQQDLVTKLIARDAAVNKTGWTPLHYAATGGYTAIMKQLLEHYAFIDAQSPNGTTPLMMAAMYGSTEAVKLLLDEGADVTMKNQQGMTAINFAQRGNRPDAAELIAAAMRGKKPADGKW